MAEPTNTFRVFVSSTFKDLVEERNALQKYVFPRLRELCQRSNCRFQAIDLRWGISRDASMEQQTMRICLEEIKRCQEVTPRPNFIVLLGDRYGSRLLPWEIPADEYEKILGTLTDDADKTTLKEWYGQLDENAVPPAHDLKARGDDFKDKKKWGDVQARLLEILDAGTVDLPVDARPKYWASATEQEIMRGVMETPDASEHVFAFFRSIQGANEKAKDAVMEAAPTDESGIDPKTRLEALKTSLEDRLPNGICKYTTPWAGDKPNYAYIGSIPGTLDECLKLTEKPDQPTTLCEDIWRKLSKIIQEQIKQLNAKNGLQKDKDAHDKWSEDRIKHFKGREGILKTIAGYIDAADRTPLAIWGAPGSGKTSLMAKAFVECKAGHEKFVVIKQLIGATPDSSDGRSLLRMLCQLITTEYGGDVTTIPADYRELIQEFPKRLALATAEKPLVLFLDALDQLSDADNARSLIWLPRERDFPEHVRIIVSTTPDNSKTNVLCFSALKHRLPEGRLIPLEKMSPEEGGAALDAMLAEVKRTLQPEQRQEIIGKFAAEGLPLYLKLAFEEARWWKSYPVAKKTTLAESISGVIEQLFAFLSESANHGELLVKRSLGLLCAAKRGLSEDELIGVLSRDEKIMQPLRTKSPQNPYELGKDDPLPVIIWSRLYFDLRPYLSPRMAEGGTVINFYHQQLKDRAIAGFLGGQHAVECHQMLAKYFESLHFETEKENRWWNESIDAQRARARRLPPTPRPANLRKVVELPYQLLEIAKLERKEECWDAVAGLLTNWEFLEAKTEADPNFREEAGELDSSTPRKGTP